MLENTFINIKVRSSTDPHFRLEEMLELPIQKDARSLGGSGRLD
jgi:hypothetical protein